MGHETEDYVLDHKLVWTGWKNNPSFKLAEEKQAEKGREQAPGAGEPVRTEAVANPPTSQKRKHKSMLLNSAQVAERLGVSPTTISSLVRKGKLKNQWTAPEGETRERQMIQIDAQEVKEFAKTYRNFKLPGRMRKLAEIEAGNGAGVQKSKGKRRGPYKKHATSLKPGGSVYLIAEDSPVQGFMTRVKGLEKAVGEIKDSQEQLTARVEEMLGAVNQLVKLWS